MSRRFTGTGGLNQITFAAGAAAGWSTLGAFTFMVIWKPASQHAGGIWRARNSGASNILVVNDFSDGHTYWTSNNQFTSDSALGTYDGTTGWELWAITRASGSVTPRFHRYRYNTATWSHADGGAATGNSPDGPIASHIVGSFDSSSYGDHSIAVAGMINSQLSDSDIETGGYITALSAWTSHLAVVWPFNQASTATSVTDVTGGGADQTAISGTTVDADDPPGFSFGGAAATLAGTLPALTGAMTADVDEPGVIAGVLPALAGALTADVDEPGVIGGTLPALTGALASALDEPGALAGVLPAVTAQLAVDVDEPGALAGVLPALAGVFAAAVDEPAVLSGALPALAGQLAAAVDEPGVLAGVLPALTGSATAGVDEPGVLAGVLPLLTGAWTTAVDEPGVLAGVLPPLAGHLSGGLVPMAAFAADLPALAGMLTVHTEPLESVVPAMAGSVKVRGLAGAAQVV